MGKKKLKIERREPYVTDEQIRTGRGASPSRGQGQQEAVAKAPDPRAAPES